MISEEERRLRAYDIWEREGRPDGRDLAHWDEAGRSGADAGADYAEYSPGSVPPGSMVIKFYRSDDQIRGYVRKTGDATDDDTIFPGEEMEPDAAFKLAESHNADSRTPVFIELVEGVEWDPSWGRLQPDLAETIPPETDDARTADNADAARRRSRLAREASKGLDRAVGRTSDPVGRQSRKRGA